MHAGSSRRNFTWRALTNYTLRESLSTGKFTPRKVVGRAAVTRMIAQPQNARSRRSRAGLLDATRELITEGGFDTLTMAAVAERAGVSRRAVYLHFRTRAELVTALFGRLGE